MLAATQPFMIEHLEKLTTGPILVHDHTRLKQKTMQLYIYIETSHVSDIEKNSDGSYCVYSALLFCILCDSSLFIDCDLNKSYTKSRQQIIV